ncbi:MAG: VOC family protein [Deltaproteobacteria bacterium]|nr:VOC family protein [Deltaproteobacteria bacterium]MBI3391152.1 VOC family protein [Deltaproteobacteria bacterium]
MVTGIDHIGIFVRDLDASLRFYTQTLGLAATPIESRSEPPIRMAYVQAGSVRLELIEASDPAQTMIRYLPRQEPGIYHVGLRVDDVDADFAALQQRGVATIDTVREGDAMRVAFLHPDAAGGVLIELVTRKDEHA